MVGTEQEYAKKFLDEKQYFSISFRDFFESYNYLLNVINSEEIDYESFLEICIKYCKDITKGIVFHNGKNMFIGPILLIWLKSINENLKTDLIDQSQV